jgi:hypothetical protein
MDSFQTLVLATFFALAALAVWAATHPAEDEPEDVRVATEDALGLCTLPRVVVSHEVADALRSQAALRGVPLEAHVRDILRTHAQFQPAAINE